MRTLGYAALAFQATGAPDPGTGGIDFVKLIADATWLSKSVLLILLLFSAVSWGIILFKIWQYRRAARDTGTFLQVFRKSTKFSEVQSICGERAGESAGRNLPGGLRRAEHAAASAVGERRDPDGEPKPAGRRARVQP